MKFRAIQLVLLGGLLILCVMLLLALSFKKYFFNTDFSNFGTIGDFFNGILSPFITALSALLIYSSFKEQVKANKIQIDALNVEKEKNDSNKEYEKVSLMINECEKRYKELKIVRWPSYELGDHEEIFEIELYYHLYNELKSKPDSKINVINLRNFAAEHSKFLKCLSLTTSLILDYKYQREDQGILDFRLTNLIFPLFKVYQRIAELPDRSEPMEQLIIKNSKASIDRLKKFIDRYETNNDLSEEE